MLSDMHLSIVMLLQDTFLREKEEDLFILNSGNEKVMYIYKHG